MTGRHAVTAGIAVFVAALCVVPSAHAQRVDDTQEAAPQPAPEPLPAPRAGQNAESAVGIVGQRQSGAQTAALLRPTGRIQNRIQNRLRSRARNRIDRNYDPQADAAAPFASAEEQARIAGQPPR